VSPPRLTRRSTPSSPFPHSPCFVVGWASTLSFPNPSSVHVCFILAGIICEGPSIALHALLLLIAMRRSAAGALWRPDRGHSSLEILREACVFIQMLFIGILFGTMITYFSFPGQGFSNRGCPRRADHRSPGEAHARNRLRLLQAQIELILFNTLSNVLSLLESDPPGEGMLEI